MSGEGDGRAPEWVCWVEGIYDAKHVARVAVTPALRPQDHPEAGSTLGKDPGQPAQPAARISKGPEHSSFFVVLRGGALWDFQIARGKGVLYVAAGIGPACGP